MMRERAGDRRILLSTYAKPVAAAFTTRYILKHIRRSAAKSISAALLAALLLGVVAQFALMRQSYIDVYEGTVVTARFIGGLQLAAAKQLSGSSYIAELYYESEMIVDLNFEAAELVITNDIARFYSEESELEFAGGYDISSIDRPSEVIIVGKALMERYGLELGGSALITPQGYLADIQSIYTARHRDEHPEEAATDNEIIELYNEQIMSSVKQIARTYMIAGVVSTPSGRHNDIVFTPGAADAAWLGTQTKLDLAEFTLADNDHAEELKSYGEAIKIGSASFIMDTSKLESPRKSIRLLDALYPCILIAALLIGGFLCCLIILQSANEAAIMRVLGTKKGKTRAMLSLEQAGLGFAGLVAGTCGVSIFLGRSISGIVDQIALFAVLYFSVILASAITCSVLATRRPPLELLQAREY